MEQPRELPPPQDTPESQAAAMAAQQYYNSAAGGYPQQPAGPGLPPGREDFYAAYPWGQQPQPQQMTGQQQQGPYGAPENTIRYDYYGNPIEPAMYDMPYDQAAAAQGLGPLQYGDAEGVAPGGMGMGMGMAYGDPAAAAGAAQQAYAAGPGPVPDAYGPGPVPGYGGVPGQQQQQGYYGAGDGYGVPAPAAAGQYYQGQGQGAGAMPVQQEPSTYGGADYYAGAGAAPAGGIISSAPSPSPSSGRPAVATPPAVGGAKRLDLFEKVDDWE